MPGTVYEDQIYISYYKSQSHPWVQISATHKQCDPAESLRL